MKLGIAEIFEKVESAETQEDRVNILRRYAENNTGLLQVIVWNMDASTPWHHDLPKQRVTYRINPYFDQQSVLYQQIRKIPDLFFENGREFTPQKRQELWILFLESLDPDDARVIESVRLRATLPFKSLTRKLVKEAFPGLLGEEVKA